VKSRLTASSAGQPLLAKQSESGLKLADTRKAKG
jgi:hypothetical protein